jgi:leucyl aminopeptidase
VKVLEFLTEKTSGAIAILALRKSRLDEWLEGAPEAQRNWVKANNFKAEPGTACLLPDEAGQLALVLYGLAEEEEPFAFAALPGKLPRGTYAFAEKMPARRATAAALGWALSLYAFNRYRSKPPKEQPVLVWPKGADRAHVERTLAGVGLARDMINAPANEMGPQEVAEAALAVAKAHGAETAEIIGDALIQANYPAIHAVGRASSRPPRLVDLRWGKTADPKVTLVGKGVCFDSGGLDLKSSSNMKLMKKDMAGAACVIALAKMIMMAKLPVRLRVLVPTVENAVAGNAFRPLDVIATRKGMTVEIGNTDAEGRLIMCEALHDAASEKPELILDFSTLTGAARSALGTEISALFCNDDALAEGLMRHGQAETDPIWRLPLWKPYRKMLDSKVADINNASDSAYAGAITAALYLQEFVDGVPWAHIDMMGWNTSTRPGRPEGGEPMAVRAAFAYLAERFGQRTGK